MKRILLFLFILLLIRSAKAQTYQYVPFPDSGAVWLTNINCSSLDNGATNLDLTQTQYRYLLFGVSKDSALPYGYSYRALIEVDSTVSNDGIFRYDSVLKGYIREDTLAKKIYFRETLNTFSPSDKVLYDFSRNVGDSLYKIRFLSYSGLNDTLTAIIARIDTVEYGGILRRRFAFDWVNDTGLVVYDTSNTFPYIEGIGSEADLLNPTDLNINTTDPCEVKLICFSYKDTTIYPDSGIGNCILTLVDGINNLTKSLSINLYPNPTTDQIHLSISDMNGPNYQLILTDILGQEVYSSPVMQSESIHDISGLSSGMYMWRVCPQIRPGGGFNTNSLEIIKTGKVVKE
jgi:hypothetical protein